MIGIDVPKALEPWEVARCVNGGPYAIKTMLVWTVNGPLRGECHSDTVYTQQHVTVFFFISLARLDELW